MTRQSHASTLDTIRTTTSTFWRDCFMGGAITKAASVNFDEEHDTAWKNFDRSTQGNEQQLTVTKGTTRKSMDEQSSDLPRQSKRVKPAAMEIYRKQHPDEIIDLGNQQLEETKLEPTPAMDWYRSKYPRETVNLHTQEIEELKTPRSYWEAMTSPQRDEWMKSMQDEVRSHVKHASFRVVKRPLNHSVLEGM
jgi:hypothetical protein